MFDSKLVDLLQKMSNKRFKKLGLMVESPYFNKKPELIQFYAFFQKHHPNYTEKKLTYEKAHTFVFPDQSFNKKEIGYLMTDLVRIIEQLLVQDKFEEQVGLKELLLMQSLLDLGLNKAFSQVSNIAKKSLSAYPYTDGYFYIRQHQLYFLENKNFGELKKHQFDESLQLSVDQLDLFYLTEKMRMACEMMNRQNVVNTSFEFPLIEEIQQFLRDHPQIEKDHPSIAIHNLIFRGFTEPEADVELFNELLSLLHEYSDLFPPPDANALYLQAINFCGRKINSGKGYFIEKLFELYKSLLTKDLILADGYISPWTFKNIVTIGVRCKELVWTENFIEEYKDQIQEHFRKNAYHYNLAYLYFNQLKYEEAIDALNQVVFDDVYYSCECRLLLLRIYYCKREIDPFYSLIDSFRVYLRRNKIITSQKKDMYLNSVRFINRLAKLVKGDNESLQFLEDQIKETKYMINKEWLLDEIKAKKR